MPGIVGLQIKVEGLWVFSYGCPGARTQLRKREFERNGNLVGHFILDRKDILQIALVALGPELSSAVGIDQCDIDVRALARLLHAAFDQIGYPESIGDF